MVFGPTNVSLHRLSTAVELGHVNDALKLAERVPVDARARGFECGNFSGAACQIGRTARIGVDLGNDAAMGGTNGFRIVGLADTEQRTRLVQRHKLAALLLTAPPPEDDDRRQGQQE